MSSPSLSRRSLLQLAGAAAASPLLPLATTHASAADVARKPLPLKIGVASYSLRKFPRDKAIAALQALDVHYVTIKDVHLARTDTPEQIRAARKQFEDAGLTIMGGGTLTWKTPDEAAMRKDFEYAKTAGMPLVVCSPAPDTLDLLEKLVKEFDIKAAIHNHGTEDPWWPAPADVLAKIGKRDPRMGVCMDIGHATRAGADVVKAVSVAGPRLLDLHIKDLTDKTNRDSQTEVGRGVLDIVGVLRELVKMKFAGHVSLEYEIKADDPVAGMA
ncbi:MAG TPA: sugar phosphate isomerase/epimerase, partial [Luteitalea sp.]|nr:sugar phosphate isomerase/epimerase [Luteitalea sp.]